VRYGEPIDFSRYRTDTEDKAALRAGTDELMYEIMKLSGQEYVDEYARKPHRAPAPQADEAPTVGDVTLEGEDAVLDGSEDLDPDDLSEAS
jgi:1-acyl-sn-glycerol-3-phosphate acyltransferase